jgi:hypothetical protein
MVSQQLPEPGGSRRSRFIADEVGISRSAQRESGSGQHFQRACVGVQPDDVTVMDPGDMPVFDRFGRRIAAAPCRKRHMRPSVTSATRWPRSRDAEHGGQLVYSGMPLAFDPGSG